MSLFFERFGSIIKSILPGLGVMTITLSPKKTASSTSCVMKTIVLGLSTQNFLNSS